MIVLKQHDRRPFFLAVLKGDGLPVDLTQATSARLIATLEGASTPAITGVLTFVVPRSSGQVSYAWQTNDTSTVGSYRAEVEVTWSDGTLQTFPNAGYIPLTILPDLA